MEQLFEARFSWAFFFTSVLILVGLFFLLRLCLRITQNVNISGRYRSVMIRYLEHAILLFEPLALVILLTIFVLIAPRIHGIIAMIIGVGTIAQIRNYFHGRAILFDQQISLGTPIKTKLAAGRVTDVGRLGIRVRNSEGLYFINYASLLNDGYSLSSEEKIGGYYQLEVIPIEENESKERQLELLRSLLIASPYIDVDNSPSIEQEGRSFLVRISVRNKEHLNDLIRLMQDRGYQTSMK